MNRRLLIVFFVVLVLTAGVLSIYFFSQTDLNKNSKVLSEVYHDEEFNKRLYPYEQQNGVFFIRGYIDGKSLEEPFLVHTFDDGSLVNNVIGFELAYLDRDNQLQKIHVSLMAEHKGETLFLDLTPVELLETKLGDIGYRREKILSGRVVEIPFIADSETLKILKSQIQARGPLHSREEAWFGIMEDYLRKNESKLATFIENGKLQDIVLIPFGTTSTLFGNEPAIFETN